jgi:DNA-binding transcriptional regulator YdaS (Cro superfamily)
MRSRDAELRALEEVIKQAGSQVALAKLLNVSPQAIGTWRLRGVPPHQVLTIERLTGVKRHRLRPDIYPQGV